jgi:predicted protein tyrosine phosphatase
VADWTQARYMPAMELEKISLRTVCGVEELAQHSARGVTHVLSILDPDWPDPDAFRQFDRHHRITLRFHDAIEPHPGLVLPTPAHTEAILAFGNSLAASADRSDAGHLLVHCHAGISRSTAAMVTLMAQAHPAQDEDSLFAQIVYMRPRAWPNSMMIGFADRQLGRQGRMLAALGRLYRRQLATFPHVAEYMQLNGRAREVEMAGA